MNKEEILNRLIQKSICINAGGKGCYSPYKNDMDWFSDIDNLIIMYEELQQENKQLKEDYAKIVQNNCYTLELEKRIDKAIEYIESYKTDYSPYELSDYNVRQILEILKGDSNE